MLFLISMCKIMRLFTKDELILELRKISERGGIESTRTGNDGSVGNMLEDILGIEENNLPIPNTNEWEIKTQRLNVSTLTTLFHNEPSPRAIKFVPKILLPHYGWKHQEANKKHTASERSFRQTIHGNSPSDRGFMVKIDRISKKVLVSFDSAKVTATHRVWLQEVANNVGLSELNPQPYWGFDDLASVARTKLLNCFYVQAKVKRENGKEYYHYCKVMMLQNFNFDGFLREIENGNILVDFDARTGHNHGTKFRMRQNCLPLLYEKVTRIVE